MPASRRGSISGPAASRFLQEAFAGYRVSPSLWVDAGIMLAPFGAENWISRDNWTYTRSWMGEFSPYYQAGIRASYEITDHLLVQLHVLNGWQLIGDNNLEVGNSLVVLGSMDLEMAARGLPNGSSGSVHKCSQESRRS